MSFSVLVRLRRSPRSFWKQHNHRMRGIECEWMMAIASTVVVAISCGARGRRGNKRAVVVHGQAWGNLSAGPLLRCGRHLVNVVNGCSDVSFQRRDEVRHLTEPQNSSHVRDRSFENHRYRKHSTDRPTTPMAWCPMHRQTPRTFPEEEEVGWGKGRGPTTAFSIIR